MPRSIRWRSALGAAALLCILVGNFQPAYWTIFGADRVALKNWLAGRPYSKMPGLREFMLGVRERTHDGDRIAVVVPAGSWDRGYAYAFVRSTYLLAGRQTVPLITEHGPQPANLRFATHIASWHAPLPPLRGFETVWQTPDGVLLRRQ